MRRTAALLAAVLAAGALTACGDGGAEPGAPQGATLVLDFTPNAVHSGIYAALNRGYFRHAGVDLTVREPGASTDAPKLLAAGRADFAILDIHDLGIANERGLDVVGVAGIVQRPLASVIATQQVGRPSDLEGRLVGVTGLPSDDAVLESVVEADGGDPSTVRRVTIGFNAIASLAAARVDAVTAFWNAEGVALRRAGVPIRVFKVDRYGAPAYPELVLCTSAALLERAPALVQGMFRATMRGYEATLKDPDDALEALLEANPGLEAAEQEAQLRQLLPAMRPAAGLDRSALAEWARWDVQHGILERQPAIEELFPRKARRHPLE